jgi:molybdenum cofactor cytidylyltransferase
MIGTKPKVGAIVLAAGASLRMGRPKLILPWEDSSVIGHVINVLEQAELDEIIVVTGGSRKQVEDAIRGYKIRVIFNPAHAEGEMLSSVQLGLTGLKPEIEAALITLGDQPFIQLEVVKLVIDAFQTSGYPITVPSYHKKRGHPWLVAKSLWNDVLALDPNQMLRDFLKAKQTEIKYVEVNTDSILMDLDTPDDYLKHQPVDWIR